MPFIPLRNLLYNSLKRSGIWHQVLSARLLDEFSKIISSMFNEDIAKEISGLYIKNRVMTVSCPSSVLAQEIKLKENEILEKLNLGRKKKVVEKIRCVV